MSEAIPVVVQKYGGSSVADVHRLRGVARRVVETVEGGYRVVVVISAMGRTTDELLELARSIAPDPPRRELDMLLSTGERIASALLSMAIITHGHEAISFTGSQCGILTNHRHTDARIVEVRPYRVQDELERGRVVIIAGYQGVSYKREVTTLGRGGSDTTAVAMAAALGAEYCEICSDVDGVYTADPRVVSSARHLEQISYQEMQELAHHGAKVLNSQAVEFAKRSGIVVYARASSGSGSVTRVSATNTSRGGAVGVAGMRDLVCIHGDGGASQLARLAETLLEHQIIVSRTALHDGQPVIWISTENCHDFGCVRAELERAGGMIWFEEGLESVTVVGEGPGNDPAYLSQALRLAEEMDLPLHSVDTSSLRLTLYLRPGKLDQAVRMFHRQFIEQERSNADG